MTCGITVAPRMPAASSMLSVPCMRGSRPAAASDTSGCAVTRLTPNASTITPSSTAMAISNVRKPLERSARMANEAAPTIRPPGSSGTPNSRYSATAPPITSARSVAMATSSACAHMTRFSGRGRCSRHSSGRLRPVARPSLAVSVCTSMAARFAATTTQTSRYPYRAPAVELVAKLPGST